MTAPIFILAGEASGDVLASRIMRAINTHYGHQNWVGLGGDHMTAEGLRSIDDMHRLSLLGLGEAIKHYNSLSAFAETLVDYVMQERPQLILTVDAKGFSVRFAARLRRRMRREGWSAPIIHTVAPTVWAWGKWRRHKFARVFDGLLCLFPFEPDYFTPLGLDCHFIGHPAAFDIQPNPPVKKPSLDAPQIAILPGSRMSEIKHILPIMLSAVALLRGRFPNAIFTLPAVPRLQQHIAAICADTYIKIVDGDHQLAATLDNCDAVMAASGTVTLEAALYGAPGVACYKAGWLSATCGRMIVDMQKVILPNAILGREVYPFLFQERLTAMGLAGAMTKILHDPQAQSTAYETAKQLRACLVGEAGQFDRLVIDALATWLGPVPAKIS
jgi:lipid-A-disaccharide synthase